MRATANGVVGQRLLPGIRSGEREPPTGKRGASGRAAPVSEKGRSREPLVARDPGDLRSGQVARSGDRPQRRRARWLGRATGHSSGRASSKSRGSWVDTTAVGNRRRAWPLTSSCGGGR